METADDNKFNSINYIDQSRLNGSNIEESDIKEAEDICGSPHEKEGDRTWIPAQTEIDRLVHSQSLSVIFQDINDPNLLKFSEIRRANNEIKEIPEDQWNDSKKMDSSIRARNFENSKTMKANERIQNNSFTLNGVNKLSDNIEYHESETINIVNSSATPIPFK